MRNHLIGWLSSVASAIYVMGQSFLFGGGTASSVGPGAEAYNNTTQTISGNTNTALTFNTNAYDTGSIHSTSVNPTRFTAPTAGYYLAICSVLANSTGASFNLFINVNGAAQTPQGGQNANTNGATNTFGSYSQILKLNAGDYIEFMTDSNSGFTTTANQSMGSLTKLSSTF